MPYLQVSQGNQEEVEIREEVETPDIIGKTLNEAMKILKEYNLEIVIEDETEELNKDETIVLNQIPKPGIKINKSNKVYIKYKQ